MLVLAAFAIFGVILLVTALLFIWVLINLIMEDMKGK